MLLLSGFACMLPAGPVDLALGAQRLLAFLCLHERPVLRCYVAGSLWPDKSETRAAANLRSALWRLHQSGLPLVDASPTHMRLQPQVTVDARLAVARARRLIDGDLAEADDGQDVVDAGDLLPDWYDDWVLIERERLRQLRLHALEAVCLALVDRGRYSQAIEAGLSAVAAEPLRESAHRALIRAHLAEGNHAEAIRQLARCRAVLEDSLGIPPSPGIMRLVYGDQVPGGAVAGARSAS